MDSYFNCFSNERIFREIAHSQNIPTLEHLIETNARERTRLSQEILGLGEIPKRRELKKILQEVKVEVDSFLDSKDVKKCKVGYKLRFPLVYSPVA